MMSTSTPFKERPHRITQNGRLLWVDANIDEKDPDCEFTLKNLRAVVNDITLFRTINDCLNFLDYVHQEKALIITSGSLGQDLIPKIHPLQQVVAIYIFCRDIPRNEAWAKRWSKVVGVFNRIEPIQKYLQKTMKQVDENFTPISFPSVRCGSSSNANLNRLEASFMYTQLFKNVIISMKHDDQEKRNMVETFRKDFEKNPQALKILDEFSQSYHSKKAIWWYTRECFTYQMLNRALRLLEGDIIVDMGFFIHDLHRRIQQLHQEQFSQYRGAPLTLYRGQQMSMDDFSKLKDNQGGLMAFNNFLSTSQKRSLPEVLAKEALSTDNMVGVVFKMIADPSVASTPFADIHEQSFFKEEAEVLFSMHSVFRITKIRPLNDNKRLFQVQLVLTAASDPELQQMTQQIGFTIVGETGWQRLGELLLKIRSLDRAEKLYSDLLQQKPTPEEHAHYLHRLGLIKEWKGDYEEAIHYYKHTIDMKEDLLSLTDPSLIESYDSIGLAYSKMKDASAALFFHHKALDIREKILPEDHPDLAISFNNIALVYVKMEEYLNALDFHEKALAIQERTLAPNDLILAISYNNIGMVYDLMGKSADALVFLKKALAIQERVLPANHSELATSYNNIAMAYEGVGDLSKALSFHTKALAIFEKALHPHHPDLATSYENIGVTYAKMGNHSQALLFLNKALEIRKRIFPPNHSDLATSYDMIANVYDCMGDCSKAFSFHSKARAIVGGTEADNPPDCSPLFNIMCPSYYGYHACHPDSSFPPMTIELRKHTVSIMGP